MYEYGGKKYDVAPHPEGPSHEKCSATVLSALKHTTECGAPQLQCTFNGAWVGNRVPQVFYVSSYFWDRATDAGGGRQGRAGQGSCGSHARQGW